MHVHPVRNNVRVPANPNLFSPFFSSNVNVFEYQGNCAEDSILQFLAIPLEYAGPFEKCRSVFRGRHFSNECEEFGSGCRLQIAHAQETDVQTLLENAREI